MAPRSTRKLLEARMRDVRQYQQRSPSGSQIDKKFRAAQQALGDLSIALLSLYPDLATQIDEIGGMVRAIEKQVAS